MLVTTSPWPTLDSLKAPNIELTLKRFVFALVEELWHDLRDEGVWAVNLEAAVVGKPRYDGVQSFRLKHRMELQREHEPPTLCNRLIIRIGFFIHSFCRRRQRGHGGAYIVNVENHLLTEMTSCEFLFYGIETDRR